MSMIAAGEAKGHQLWIDNIFLAQVADAMAAAGKAGVKSRFTHPDMSADGLAKFLGRSKTGKLDGDRVTTDLHLAASAHRSPDGDLAGYVMDRTEEDPGSFGASIVFYRDAQAETAFALANGATAAADGSVDWSAFVSPDPANAGNLIHARLAELYAADLVDEPAANPSGMFHRSPVDEFSQLADYALSLTADPPEAAVALSVDSDRLRNFAERYLENRGLKIVKAEATPADPPPLDAPPADPPPDDDDDPADEDTEVIADDELPDDPPPAQPPPAPEPPPADDAPPAAAAAGPDRTLAEYCQAFGDGPGARYFLDGLTWAQAQDQTIAKLRAEAERLRAKVELGTKEHPHPIPVGGPSKKTLRDLTRIRR
jgi:hypothetical protein